MCFVLKFVFEKNAQHLKNIFLAYSKKKMMLTLRGGLLVVVVFKKPLAFFSAKMRVVILLVSPRYSQHILGIFFEATKK